MTTTIRGWCAWHKDRGFELNSFSTSGSENVLWAGARSALCSLADYESAADDLDILTDKLKDQGWRIRPCKVTIEPTDTTD